LRTLAMSLPDRCHRIRKSPNWNSNAEMRFAELDVNTDDQKVIAWDFEELNVRRSTEMQP